VSFWRDDTSYKSILFALSLVVMSTPSSIISGDGLCYISASSGDAVAARRSTTYLMVKVFLERLLAGYTEDIGYLRVAVDDDTYRALLDEVLDNECKYYKWSYHYGTRTLLLYGLLLPPIHASIVDFFQTIFFRIPSSLIGRDGISMTRYRSYFFDDGSEKIADLAICSNDTLYNYHKLTFEIGSVSKSYEDLVEDAKLWLECTEGDVCMCVLVKIAEQPRYRSPLKTPKRLSREESREIASQMYDFADAHPLRPIEYHGYDWVGQVSCFAEVWMPDVNTEKAICVGDRVNIVDGTDPARIPDPTSYSFCLQDIMDGLDEKEDVHVTFDWLELRKCIAKRISGLAYDRYMAWTCDNFRRLIL